MFSRTTLEKRVSMTTTFSSNPNEPFARLRRAADSLRYAWEQLPSPGKAIVWTGVIAAVAVPLRAAAPRLRQAADILGLTPTDLLQMIQNS